MRIRLNFLVCVQMRMRLKSIGVLKLKSLMHKEIDLSGLVNTLSNA